MFTAHRIKQILLRFISHIVILCLWNNSIALAALPITADGTTNTQVTTTASGIDQVNIAAPNASGLSHNKFTDYNVNNAGLILNNSTGHAAGVVSTTIGGLVVDNPNLASSGAARVILNEVTSSNTSQILGYTEIAGTGASLILANPNGFSFNGAGFLNVSKLTAVVGSSNADNPNVTDLSFSLTSLDKYVIDSAINSGFLPKITITGSGLDLENVSTSELVASLMEIVAPIYAADNDLNLLSGDQSFDYATSTVTSSANINPNPTDVNGDPIEEIAIDASSLGEITAGKIFIVATKEGFGVKFSNDMIASVGGVSVDVAGDISYNNIEASKLDLTSNSDINQQAGSAVVVEELNILSADNFNLGDNAFIISSNDSKTLTINSHALNFNNDGIISAESDLLLNIDHNFINKTGALVYSGNNMELNIIGDLTNNKYASIYAYNDLTIQKYALDDLFSLGIISLDDDLYKLSNPDRIENINKINKIAKLENISAEIASYQGNILINASDFINYRSNDNLKTTIVERTADNAVWYDDFAEYKERGSHVYGWRSALAKWGGGSHGNSGIDLSGDGVAHQTNLFFSLRDGWHLESGIKRYNKYRRVENLNNISSIIQANIGSLTINSDSFLNDSSQIYAKEDITIHSNSFLNKSTDIYYTVNYECNTPSSGVCFIDEIGRDEKGKIIYTNLAEYLSADSSYDYEEEVGSISGIIKSGAKVDIHSSDQTDNGTITEDASDLPDLSGNYASIINPSISDDYSTINVNILPYLNGPDNQGMFTKNDNPNAPLFETRSRFIDQSLFVGSDYFYTALGIDPEEIAKEINRAQSRLIGDQFFQEKIIANQLSTISKTRLSLAESNINSADEIKNLMDNAAIEKDRLGLDYNTTLTSDQIANLENDIIWYEFQEIDGSTYVVPKIYLAQASRDRLKGVDSDGIQLTNNLIQGSTIYAGGDLNITSSNSDIHNRSGSMVAGNNINLTTHNGYSINNKKGLIFAENNVLLDSDGDITGYNSDIIAKGEILLDAENNIELKNTLVESGARVAMNAIHNINLFNSNIHAQNDIAMHANNINNIHHYNGDDASQVEARIEAGGSISLNATKDVDGNGGNITNLGGTIESGSTLSLTAENDIYNLALIDYTINHRTVRKGIFVDSYEIVNASEEEVLASNADHIRSKLISQGNLISGGNLILVADNDIHNKASKITATGSALLEASNGDVNITTAILRDRTVKRWWSKKNRGMSIDDKTTNLASSINITGDLAMMSGADTNILGSDVTVGGSLTTDSTGDLNIASVQDSRYNFFANYRRGSMGSRSKTISESTRVTNREANITVVGDINTTSLADINIIASNLTTTSGNINLIAKNDVNILSALDIYHEEKTDSKRGTTGKTTSTNILSTKTNVTSDIVSAGDLTIRAGDNINVLASNLSGGGSGILEAGKYLDLELGSSTYNSEIFNADANVNILNGTDTSYVYSQTIRTSTGLNLDNIAMVAIAIAAIAVTGGASIGAMAGMAGGLSPLMVEHNVNNSTAGSYTESIIKSDLSFAGNLIIASGNDINIKASDIAAGIDPSTGSASGQQGDVSLYGGIMTTTDYNTAIETVNTNENAQVNILSDSADNYSYSINETISIGGSNIEFSHDKITIGNMVRNTSRNSSSTHISSSIISNNGNININSQNNLNILASNLATSLDSDHENDATLGQINLTSETGNVNILSAYNTSTSSSETLSGDVVLRFELDSNQLALLAGIEAEGSKDNEKIGEVVSSNLVASAIHIISGSSLSDDDIGSSEKGNININSANISAIRDSTTLLSFNDTNFTTSSDYHEITHSDFELSAHVRLGISYNFKEVWQSIEALKDVKLENAVKYLVISSATGYLGAGAATPYLSTYGPLIAGGDSFDESLAENGDYINDANTINNAGKGGSGSAGFTVELAYQESKWGSKQTSVVANNIFSNSDIYLTSSHSDLNIASSNLSAYNDINLNAREGNINITADTNNSDSFSRSFGFTISVPIVGKGGAGSINFSKSKSESQTYVNSSLMAGNDFNLNSKADTNIISSNILASNIDMTVGGNLNLESKQNAAKSKAISFAIGGGYNSSGGGSGSGNLSYSKSTSKRNWVDHQASILGTSSVIINVGETTNLIGSVIANSTNGETSKNGIDGGNLTLNTKELTYKDFKDVDKARSFGIGVSGNAKFGGKSGGTKGSASLELNYAMHDFRQDTNATIGSGVIRTGTTLNLDDNNNVISISSGEIYNGNINRDIKIAQLETKHLEVAPIEIRETFDFDTREGSKSKTKRPSIWSNMKDGEIDIVGGILSNAKITTAEFISRIYPVNAFSNITYGIATDIGNLSSEITGNDNALEISNNVEYYMNESIKKAWASPNTALGLTYGTAGYLYGIATGQEVKFSIGNNAVQFLGNPLGAGGALTLGNTTNYFGIKALPGALWPTYEANDGSWTASTFDSVRLGGHEGKHTIHSEILGPLYLPTYFFAGVIWSVANGEFTLNPVNKYNPMERDADVHGNKLLMNQTYGY